METEAASQCGNKSPVTQETVSRCRTLVFLFRDYPGGWNLADSAQRSRRQKQRL